MKTAVGKAITKTAGVLLIFIALVYLYTLMHEGGHALVAMMYGGKIDRFVLGFNAHVAQSGADFTQFGNALSSSAGVLLPAVILAIALLFYNRNIKHLVYHFIYAETSIVIISSLLAWVAIPLISLVTAPPAGDDVTHFLDALELNPLLVSLAALMMMFLLAFFAYKKGLYSKVIATLKVLSKKENPRLNKWQTMSMVLVPVLFVSVILVCNQILFQDKVFETAFSMKVQDDRQGVEMPFKVVTSKSYNMSLKLEAEGMLSDVQIYDDKGNTVYQNICEWFTLSTPLDLKKGNYQFVLTFIRDPEVMKQYFEEKKYIFSQEQIDGLNEMLIKNYNDEFIPVSFSAIIK